MTGATTSAAVMPAQSPSESAAHFPSAPPPARPQRPSAPVRTPSNTYNPPRRPHQYMMQQSSQSSHPHQHQQLVSQQQQQQQHHQQQQHQQQQQQQQHQDHHQTSQSHPHAQQPTIASQQQQPQVSQPQQQQSQPQSSKRRDPNAQYRAQEEAYVRRVREGGPTAWFSDRCEAASSTASFGQLGGVAGGTPNGPNAIAHPLDPSAPHNMVIGPNGSLQYPPAAYPNFANFNFDDIDEAADEDEDEDDEQDDERDELYLQRAGLRNLQLRDPSRADFRLYGGLASAITGEQFDSSEQLALDGANAPATAAALSPTREELARDPRNKERLEWHSMLETVLKGDVVRQEKKRIINIMEQKTPDVLRYDLWVGIKAKACGRTLPFQERLIKHGRETLGSVIEEIISFQIKGESETGKTPLEQVREIMAKIEKCEALYPNDQQLRQNNQRAASQDYQESRTAVIAWHNTTWLINTQLNILKRWVGNDELDFARSMKVPSSSGDDVTDEGSFLDRLMKENNLLTLQSSESMLNGISQVIQKAKSTLIEHSFAFRRRHLPPYIEELLTLINFPSRLIQEVIRLRVSYAKKMRDPGQQSSLLLDQMIDQFRILLRVAVDIKARYVAVASPDKSWDPPPCVDENFDETVVDALKYYFRLLNWKLSANKNAFKEAEILEVEWGFSNDIGRRLESGDVQVAEQFSTLTAKALQRLMINFEKELQFRHGESPAEMEKRYKQVLDSVRVRQRKLFRFSRMLRQDFENATEFHLKPDMVDTLSDALLASGHFLVTSNGDGSAGSSSAANMDGSGNGSGSGKGSGAGDNAAGINNGSNGGNSGGVNIAANNSSNVVLIAAPILWDKPKVIQGILGTSFRSESLYDLGRRDGSDEFMHVQEDKWRPYILAIRCSDKPFKWAGKRISLDNLEYPSDVRLGKMRLIADGTQARLANARAELAKQTGLLLDVSTEQRANLGRVNIELNKIKKTASKLASAIIDSVEVIRRQSKSCYPPSPASASSTSVSSAVSCQTVTNKPSNEHHELIQTFFDFATEFGKRSLMYLDPSRRVMNYNKLVKLALDWVSFICDDCDAADRKTFKWAVTALENAMVMTHGNSILAISTEDYLVFREKVAGCMSVLISHFDIMGARSRMAARAKDEASGKGVFRNMDLNLAQPDSEAMRAMQQRRVAALQHIDLVRVEEDARRQALGRVLEGANEADRSVTVLSSAATNITMRWQQGQYLGGGTSGSVFAAIDLDTSFLMAVKEIRLQDASVIPAVAQQIRDEMSVLEILDHPNIVSYHGIEVHRDKVYIFMEYCSGGSLAELLEHGRIEDETVIMVYALQMLEGLAYLHEAGVVHRDIKPANILLDHNGVIKYVDFGAAIVMASRKGKTLPRHGGGGGGGGGSSDSADGASHEGTASGGRKHPSVTGTPMYMSPELVRGELSPSACRLGAVDIWSLGCVILEMATGQRPWANLDNEWAIMYKIAQGSHPHLPTPDQLSPEGIDFVRCCFEIDPLKRPTAAELLQHEWIVTIRNQVVAEPLQTPSESNAGSGCGVGGGSGSGSSSNQTTPPVAQVHAQAGIGEVA
ncbi:Suppressor of Sensor Kinase (SLN1) [Ascosphaera acerosa]|nr:Suppressor of Sensor Kinase (SLN1) [Ascosphaera acerosa]